MEIIISILMFLGFVQPDNCYTQNQIQMMCQQNQPLIQSVIQNPQQMHYVQTDYTTQAAKVEIIDMNAGN